MPYTSLWWGVQILPPPRLETLALDVPTTFFESQYFSYVYAYANKRLLSSSTVYEIIITIFTKKMYYKR